jgi:hypothetical protein
MRHELDPRLVSLRLAALRSLYVPERDDEARRRIERERPTRREPFERAVARRLAELRALCALADYLQRAGSSYSARGEDEGRRRCQGDPRESRR